MTMTTQEKTRTLIGIATLIATILTLLLAAGSALATGAAPVIAKAEASEMKRTSIKVCAEVDPEGEETTYQIGYTKFVAGATEKTTTPQSAGEGETSTEKCVEVTGLEVNAPYRVVFEAKNATGEKREEAKGSPASTVAVEGVETLPETKIAVESATLNGALEPNGYDTHYYFECIREKIEHESVLVPAKPGADAGSATELRHVEVGFTGLSGNTEYTCQLLTTNTLGGTQGQRVSFSTPKAPPVVNGIPLEARDLTGSSAAVAGEVTVQNETTRYWIEYAPEQVYDATAENPYANGARSPGGEIEATWLPSTAVLVGLNGLAPATTYHYRMVAENGTGKSYGPDNTFTTAGSTPPVVVTGAVTGVSATTATISGSVNPQGLKTSYEFQFGETPAYGGAEIFGNAGEGEAAETVATAFQYLIPGTTYHYRVVAVNADGTTYGADQTFTTPGVVSPIVQAPNAPLVAFTPIAFPTEKEPTPVKTKTKKKPKKRKKSGKTHGARHGRQVARKGKSRKKR
ncbi:MAG TPA: hypothetical protein VFW38_09645 [Solirubrobacteraceae bacterium]|nr:hypothetical protein [Solirubrobacteraceae bacterium]